MRTYREVNTGQVVEIQAPPWYLDGLARWVWIDEDTAPVYNVGGHLDQITVPPAATDEQPTEHSEPEHPDTDSSAGDPVPFVEPTDAGATSPETVEPSTDIDATEPEPVRDIEPENVGTKPMPARGATKAAWVGWATDPEGGNRTHDQVRELSRNEIADLFSDFAD